MIIALLLCALLAATIYFSCEFFVNGVEWVGHRLHLGSTATGTVLAAVGTALPESAVTFVAVVFGRGAAQRDVGVGAALGGPLVLATIGYAVVGSALWLNGSRRRRRGPTVQAQYHRLSRDQAWFLVIFIAKVGLGLVAFAFKPALGTLFLAAYAFYVWKEVSHPEAPATQGELEALKLRPRDASPALAWALIQTAGALTVIGAASRVFVSQLGSIAQHLQLAPHFVALLLSPIATELPETMNAVIWVRQRRERLALANLSGAMMIQATVPSAFGIYFTPWLFDATLLWSGIITAVAVSILLGLFRRGRVTAAQLVPICLLYGVFLVIAIGVTHGK